MSIETVEVPKAVILAVQSSLLYARDAAEKIELAQTRDQREALAAAVIYHTNQIGDLLGICLTIGGDQFHPVFHDMLDGYMRAEAEA